MSSVTTSTGSQQVDFVAPKSLAAMLKSSARPAYSEQFPLLLFAGCKLDQCIIIFTIFYHLTFHTIDLQNLQCPFSRNHKSQNRFFRFWENHSAQRTIVIASGRMTISHDVNSPLGQMDLSNTEKKQSCAS